LVVFGVWVVGVWRGVVGGDVMRCCWGWVWFGVGVAVALVVVEVVVVWVGGVVSVVVGGVVVGLCGGGVLGCGSGFVCVVGGGGLFGLFWRWFVGRLVCGLCFFGRLFCCLWWLAARVHMPLRP
ncbi:hypothetical protein RA268_28100, partial [Pseudomonas syringae pv. tagetis]